MRAVYYGAKYMKFGELKTKVQGAPAYVKRYWKTPNEGEYLSLSEMVL